MKDGTFWISDEYGPHIVHYDEDGKQIERISPFGMDTGKRHLPAVLARRRANRGMEGLAANSDGKILVGIMQFTLFNPSKKEISNKQHKTVCVYPEQGDRLNLRNHGTFKHRICCD